ncbi:hypothetical protein TERMP_00158 [Thermococcus barophilus MP]|uniref:Uncharacterized protein n=1 Tax=Thermococcus barophilus (strain DSM 11836 / MP) TaxID=391623 RepID=F0LHQ1_THEBM|nr:hypothetical protein TERMP_00158 [Thermococcus barophilus MP]
MGELIPLIVQGWTEQTNPELLDPNKDSPKILPPDHTKERAKNNPALQL